MSRRALTPAKATLLMLGVGTLSLMGIPGVGTDSPPLGALNGTVRADGQSVAEATLALFDGDQLELIELTRTDARGRFAFQKSPRAFHVFAAPARQSGLVGGWILARPGDVRGSLDLTLERGRRIRVQVRTEAGDALAGAELRAYTSGPEPHVVLRTRTDEEGLARIVVPPTAHLAVFPDDEWLPAWRFEQEMPERDGYFELTVFAAKETTGRVTEGDGRPLAGVIVSAWDERGGSLQWNGYSRTDTWGAFALRTRGTGSVLRALPTDGRHLPGRRIVQAEESAEDIILSAGRELEIRCQGSVGEAVPARVWIWSEQANTWSWGGRTDDDGTLRARVSELHSVVAFPAYGASGRGEAWDHVAGKEPLVLRTGDGL